MMETGLLCWQLNQIAKQMKNSSNFSILLMFVNQFQIKSVMEFHKGEEDMREKISYGFLRWRIGGVKRISNLNLNKLR